MTAIMSTLKFIALALFTAGASAFAPVGHAVPRASVKVHSGLNGWVPDDGAFCGGLPGSLEPVPEFGAQACEGRSIAELKQWREAETAHGRVAMLATIGLLTAESFHPLFGGEIFGPAIDHLTEVRKIEPLFFEVLAVAIGAQELNRALIGWVPPSEVENNIRLNDDYYPGDLGFDPLGLKPADGAEFAEMQTKELQHGRLAMIGISGMVAQELVNHEKIFQELDSLPWSKAVNLDIEIGGANIPSF